MEIGYNSFTSNSNLFIEDEIVVLGASKLSILGMFMLPKTICYMLIVFAFKNKLSKEG